VLKIIDFTGKRVSINKRQYYLVFFEDTENGLTDSRTIFDNYCIFGEINNINEDISRIDEIVIDNEIDKYRPSDDLIKK
jgi:hypothetical protein